MKLSFPWRPKLRLKFIIIFLGLTIIPLVFAMSITILRVQNIQRESATALNNQVADTAATAVELFVVRQFQILQDIGGVQREFLQDSQLQDKLLERFLFQNDDFVEISIVDWNGKETSRKHRLRVFGSESFRDRSQTNEFLQVRENLFYISPVYISLGRPFFEIGVALAGPEGVFQGVIFAQVDARLMQDVVKDISSRVLKGKGRSYIVDEEGTVIAHPDPSVVLRETTFALLPAVQAMIQDFQVSSIESYENEQHEQVIGNGRPITFTFSQERTFSPGWFVVVEQPTSIALAAVTGITQFSIIVLGIVLLLSVATALLLAQSLTRPIRELQKGAAQIGLGNLDYSFRINTNDELEDLAAEMDKMRLRLREIRGREENLSRLKSEFVSIVAHQLRTPLSALKWALSLFEEAKPKMPAEQKELVKKMNVSNERMIRLVNDLLDAARIEEGRFVYNRKETSFEKILNPVLAAVKQKAEQKNIRLIVKEPKEPLPETTVDIDAMELVLQNLIENAIHYTLPGGRVEISATRSEDNSLLVSIEDNGIGIAPEEKERIFTKFFRGANAIRLETEGSGLGLFIVKNIVEAHGENIWFESTQGKGTTFHFTIPLR